MGLSPLSYTNTLTVDEAFERYEAIRPRLPTAPAPGSTEQCAGLLDIADDFDAFVLDSFGVLNVGETAIPGAVECIRRLRDRGKRLIILTNAASYTRETALARYHKLGFDFTADEVVSSRTVCTTRLEALAPNVTWGAIAAEDDRFADIAAPVKHWSGETDVGGFLLLSSARLTDELYTALADALAQQPRPVAVANPDLVAPRETGLSKEPGFYAHALADRLGITPTFFGKPFANAFEDALAPLAGLNRARIAMVGDTLHTDILGGAAAGLKTLLVRDHGLFAGRDTGEYIAKCGIVPDYSSAQI